LAPALPTGTLTFLFTDIEGSTHLWEQYPEQMGPAMARHDKLIESAVVQHAGSLVRPRGEGDSRFAVFRRASDALCCAIAIQRLLLAEPWVIPAPRVRVALHLGEADLRDGDYYGSTVNRCARLRSAAHGGQILVSETIRCLVSDGLPTGVSLLDLGEYNLKGLERPENIFQVIAADLPAEFPPLNTPGQFCNNLPFLLTSFIGRGQDVDELENLLGRSRLLTISGPGGAGKTRLAIQVSQNVRVSFPDGIWFIDLGPLSKSSLLSQYIIKVLGIREEAGRSLDQMLVDNLQSKKSLLILDNCEHLLPEVALVAEAILRRAPRVRILATSREKLGVPGEVIWRIPPLTSPDPKEATIFENLMQYESVRLFQDRASAASSNFTISRENAGAVAQICARLDGLPLAIELAAARVSVLSVEEIARRLDDRFRLLVGPRTALPRQRTLNALIHWSYDLLSEKERYLLHRLSVFSGGWTLEAAEQVCWGVDIEAADILDLLTNLIDKSFVVGETRNDHQRYRFLETIHKFSQERLFESNGTDEFVQKHATYFLRMTVNSYGKVWGPEQALWLAWLDEEYDNLRSALEWFSQTSGNEELLLQIAGSLWRYWEIRGYLSEGRVWLETALAKNSEKTGYWHANGLGGAGHLARQQGDYERAQALHEQSLHLFRELGYKLDIARQLNALGEIAQHLGNYSYSTKFHEESLALRYEIGDKEGIAVSLRQLGVIARDQSQYQRAKELLEESMALERELGDKLLLALTLSDLGLVAYHLCEYERATLLFTEAKSIQGEFNDRLGISNSLQNLGNLAKDQGDFVRAEQFFKQSLALKKEIGDKRGISRVVTALAEVAFWQGKYPLAADLAAQSLSLSQELGLKRVVLTSKGLLGFISLYQGNYERSVQLADEILVLAMQVNAPQGTAYANLLLALGKYSEGYLKEAMEKCQEALEIFKQVNDCRNIAGTYVNLARTAYRLGENAEAMHYLEESLSISRELNIRWNLGFVLEIMGLLERNNGNYNRSLELFQESLHLALEQENQQGIVNCLGALAGLAVVTNQANRAARLFAAAAKLSREMGVKMSDQDSKEYENYLAMVHERLDHTMFEVEWSEGFRMATEQVIEELNEWLGDFNSAAVSN